nr:mucin-2 isoform X2 [Misgurnus anguillicaudatus]
MVHKLLGSDNMVSKEPNHLPSVHTHSNGNPDKAATTVTVRSVLLNRNSPDIESRLKRRRNRTQQVRFKDLDDDEVKNDKVRSKSPTEVPKWRKELTNGPSLVGSVCGDMEKTIGAVTAFLKRAPPHPLTPGPTRRCWVPTHPCSLTLPLPSQPCRSTAIQTSPSLEKPPSLSVTQIRSYSLGDGVGGGWDDEDSSDELTAQVCFSTRTSQTSPGQEHFPTEQSGCSKTEDNQTTSLDRKSQLQPSSSAPHKQSRRRGRRKLLNRAASDPGKPEPPHTSPSNTVPAERQHQNSNQSKKAPSEAVVRRTLSSDVPSQHSPNHNPLHNMPCSGSSTQTEPSCDSKSQSVSGHQASLQTGLLTMSSVTLEEYPNSCQILTAEAPLQASQTVSTCPNETQNVPLQSCPPQGLLPGVSLTQTEHSTTISESLCFTTQQVTSSSTHGESSLSLSETSGHCCTPAIQMITNSTTPPMPKSCCISESHAESVTPDKSRPGCQTLEESMASYNNVGQKAISCSQGASVVSSSFSTAHPGQKTPTQPLACNNTPIQPVSSVICPTQSVTPIQSVPSSKVPAPNARFGTSSLSVSNCIPDTQTVQTTTLTTNTPTPIQSTIQPSIQSIPYCDISATLTSTEPIASHKDPTQPISHNMTSFSPSPPHASTPYSVSHLKSSLPPAAHIVPIGQTAVHCILDPQNMGTHVTPALPVLICSPSTQPVPGNLCAVRTLPHCSVSVQHAPCCSNPPQTVHNFKTSAQTVPHSKSFPHNMSPILCSREPTTYTSIPQETVLPCANFRHSLPPYACTPQTALLYSNTGTYPSPPQAFCSTQDRRDRREFMLPPPPPPPPPPYTPRKEDSSTPGKPRKPPVSKADSNSAGKDKVKTGIAKSNAEAKTDEIPPPIPPKSKARAMVKPTCLGTRRAILGTESQSDVKHLPPSAGINPQTPLRSAEGQGDTLRQVQELLGGLMSGAKCKLDLAKAKEKLFGPNGPLYDIGTLQSQLHSLEGVLETSQNTIKVLLDVIQDLEKKEAEREGTQTHAGLEQHGHSYRTGQDIENCGTCRDCACIIYSVEHDFRLQEGQVTRAWKVPEQQESEQSSPQLVFSPPRQQESPQSLQTVKKSRRKCFWFL